MVVGAKCVCSSSHLTCNDMVWRFWFSVLAFIYMRKLWNACPIGDELAMDRGSWLGMIQLRMNPVISLFQRWHTGIRFGRVKHLHFMHMNEQMLCFNFIESYRNDIHLFICELDFGSLLRRTQVGNRNSYKAPFAQKWLGASILITPVITQIKRTHFVRAV